MNKEFVREVYESLWGAYVEPMYGVEDAFEEGKPCDVSYGEIFDASERLRQRLGVQNDDRDVDIINNAWRDIAEELGFLMYKYGAKFGNQEEKILSSQQEKEEY
ncbi:MAG: hypothetical protein Q4F79_00695 [Eubacteriales bacterium]|nr:hypothetical protein [Eubacteriales bacterium]